MKKTILILGLALLVLLSGCTQPQNAPEQAQSTALLTQNEAKEFAITLPDPSRYIEYYGSGKVKAYTTIKTQAEMLQIENVIPGFQTTGDTWVITLINSDFDDGQGHIVNGPPCEPPVGASIEEALSYQQVYCSYLIVFIDKNNKNNTTVVVCSKYGCNPNTPLSEYLR